MKTGAESEIPFWAMQPRQLFRVLKTSEKGLNNEEVKARLAEYGQNRIEAKQKRTALDIFISQFTNALVLVLIFAAMIAYFIGEPINSIVILAIVFVNSIIGFIQEYRAEKALEELNKYITINAKVLRNGEVAEIDSRELVPGDIVHLNIGDIIPADIRLLHVDEMSTDESILTGESIPVMKKAVAVSEKHKLPYELSNMAFMGTSVSSGAGYGIVVSTGKNTFFGKSAVLVQKELHETDFQKSIRKFSNFLLKIILVMTLFIFVANALLGKGYFDSFLFALALAVGITPELLPVIITISLSNGALRMAKEKVVMKRLASVEDLGNMDTLCCDKTGTLTEGKLSLINYINSEGKKDARTMLYGILCNSAEIGRRKKTFGNPVDRAILESSDAALFKTKIAGYQILHENEFDFERRRMSVIVRARGANTMIAKGAPESVFRICTHAYIKGRKVALTKKVLAPIAKMVSSYEQEGYKIIAVAEKPTRKKKTTKEDEREMILVGFLIFMDLPKKTASEAIQDLQKLYVGVKILSGDSPLITRKICNEVGLAIAEDKVVSGDELERLDDRSFEEYCNRYNVFARVTPAQKYKIVSLLKREGHIVGFLGDGINDVPALKSADVGISVDSAVGIAKEEADVILLKKSLRVLANGIREGRKTFGNIMKYILNTISANFGNMFTMAISSVFLMFIPLLPSQILLNNFLSDLPLLTLSTDNVDEGFLRKPKRWNLEMISKFMMNFGLISVVFDLALILPLILVFNTSAELFRTAWFVESSISEVIVTFAIRTKQPFLRNKPSKWLIATSLITIFLVAGITYTAFGFSFFEFVSMPLEIVGLIVVVLLLYFITAEIFKRKFFKKFDI
ncbi:MAG: magnesium-translocating P-type ATPase [Candidatus Anstonellales archaeon]